MSDFLNYYPIFYASVSFYILKFVNIRLYTVMFNFFTLASDFPILYTSV